MILDFLANSGKEYIKDNGEIDYLAILTDCMSAAAKYGIKTTLSETEKRKYADFSKDVVTAFAECTQDTDAINKALEKANHSYFEKFKTNANLEKTEYFQKIVAETLNGMNNDNNIITYADQVNTLLKNSNISVSLKKELKTITSVTINSQLYWNNI